MTRSTFKNLELAFWAAYFVLPIYTGWLVYKPSLHEYDETRDVLLDSHPVGCGTESFVICDFPDKWRDGATGQIYTSGMFLKHHRSESWRISLTAFAYGLIGCLFFAYGRIALHRGTFLKGFQKALMTNAAISIFVYWII